MFPKIVSAVLAARCVELHRSRESGGLVLRLSHSAAVCFTGFRLGVWGGGWFVSSVRQALPDAQFTFASSLDVFSSAIAAMGLQPGHTDTHTETDTDTDTDTQDTETHRHRDTET